MLGYSSSVGSYKIAFEDMDREIFRQIFTAYVGPKSEYASPVWRGHVDSVEGVQRRVTKIMTEKEELSYRGRIAAVDFPA